MTEWAVGTFTRSAASTRKAVRTADRDRSVTARQRIRHRRRFQRDDFFPSAATTATEMFAELLQIVEQQIDDEPSGELVQRDALENAAGIKRHGRRAETITPSSAGTSNTLSVVRTAVFLADKYRAYYTEISPPLSKSLLIAGAVCTTSASWKNLNSARGWSYTARPAGRPHSDRSRDMVRKKAESILELDGKRCCASDTSSSRTRTCPSGARRFRRALPKPCWSTSPTTWTPSSTNSPCS